ncbi:MAG: polysaccharide deacetylase family protein, partial [Campylobacterales bacterium]|nr:polysaccharide deacetylase family protein [Campylobacterales bacterium]
APGRYRSSLVVTHDVDYIKSVPNMKKFMDIEKELGIRSTFFIQTKYITDDKDEAFFTPENFYILKRAHYDGFELGSHTIIHTKNFFKLKEGNYSENYPTYKPFSFSETIDLNKPTVSGELKVSKELIGGIGTDIESFRSGELVYNPKLPIAMEKLGYRYSSCFSAEDVLSYFPYRYKRDYANLTNQSFIFEIPLSYEDEELPPLYFRVENALKLFNKIYENGGVFNLLIHPDMTLFRLKNLDIYFEKSFIKKLPKDVWIATIRDIGNFWDRRDKVIFRYSLNKKILNLDIYSPADIKNLSFDAHNIMIDSKEDQNVIVSNNKIVLNVKKGLNHWSLKIL